MSEMTGALRLSMRTKLDKAPLFTVGWNDAVFAHYKITAPEAIESRLPQGLKLDLYQGHPYLSIVSFCMKDMSLWGGLKLPFSHTYPQINIRVYVTDGESVGVFFLRNYVSHRLAAWAGRTSYGMPYRYQKIEPFGQDFGYRGTLPSGQEFSFGGAKGNEITGHENDPNSLLFFLVERYPLFSARGKEQALHKAHMYHPPWPVHELGSPQIDDAAILQDLGLTEVVESLREYQCSAGVDVDMWAPKRQ